MISKNLLKISGFLDNIKMRPKLLLIYFILIILPLSFFTFLTHFRISDIILKQTLDSASQTFEESAEILDRDFRAANNVVKIITGNQLLYDVAVRTFYNSDMINEFKDISNLSDLFTYLKSNTNLEGIHLYTFGGYISIENNIITKVKNIQDVKWYKTLIQGDNNTIWITPFFNTDSLSQAKDSFSVARLLYNPYKLKEKIAVLKVDIQGGRVDNIIKNTLITNHCISYITDGISPIRSTATEEVTGNFKLTIDPLDSLINKGWNKIMFDMGSGYVNVKSLELNGWYFVTIIPDEDIAAMINKLRNQMLLTMVFIFIAAYILAYLISASSIKRLSLLSTEMRKIETSLTGINLPKKGTDEIGELMEDFNNMVLKINTLVDEKYKMGIEIKSSELKALQAQINPHFLYNTLELINSTALMRNVPEIAAQVTALAKFYRLSLTGGKDIISVQDELEHIRIYVQIQNMRFQNRITLSIDADTEVYACRTLKTILQPIVENAIIHGIFEKDNKSGTLVVKVYKEYDTVIFIIEDNGVGMTQEKLKEILSDKETHQLTQETSGGYGIRNINQRIKLYYGQEYGLSYFSSPGAGTRAIVRIPVSYS